MRMSPGQPGQSGLPSETSGAARLPRRPRPTLHALAVAALGIASLGLVSCGRWDAHMALKNGNHLYKEGKFERAIATYAQIPPGVPQRVQSAFATGYAHMAQYRFGSKHPKDREHAAKAVVAFEEFLKIRPPEAKIDEHNPDPEKVEEWILTLLVDAEHYDEAIARMKHALEKKPNDPALLRGLASTYDKWGKPTLALGNFQQWAKFFPTDPAPQVAIAAYCWNLSYRQATNLEPLERNRWVDNGLAASDAALKMKPDHFEALTYKNLLIRERAKLRIDPDQVAVLLKDANVLLQKAKELREKAKAEEEAAKAKAAPSPAAKTSPGKTT